MLVNIGYGNVVNMDRVVSIVSADQKNDPGGKR